MIKYVILFIHLIGLSIYQLFFGDVTASQKIPNQIKAGEEVTVEVLISKDDVTGFAKFQETIPVGFTAEVIDAKGATFSFKENIIKFIWMALPADKEFTIQYKLKASDQVSGDFTFGGKFSFISDNERKNVDIPNSTVTIVKNAEVLAVKEEVKEPAKVNVVEPVKEIVSENTTKEVSIKTTRIVENIGNKYKVSLTITQSNLEGFAKFVDIIPAGFSASTDNPEGGIFSYSDNEAKILWMSAPKKEEFIVSYFLEPNSNTGNGEFEIKGTISYLENDITKKYTVNSSTFQYTGQIVAKTEPIVVKEDNTTIAENKQPVTEKQAPKENKSKPVVTSIPSAEKGVTYKVQVAAGHQTVSKNYFASKFNLTDPVSTEAHEGWVKYIVGKFIEYKEARDKRNDVRNNVKNAFVTAYNQGKRITVQEALMISNQKWYQ